MLRKFLLSICLLAASSVFGQSKFGVVDFQNILESLSEYNLVKLQLQETSNRYNEEYKKMSEDIDRKFEDYQTINTVSTPESIKQRRVQEIQNLQKRAEQFLETAENDLQRQENQLVDPIKVRVKDAIRQVGEELGFTFIFPIDAPLFQGVEVEDLTEVVKQKLH